jgi:hypothetical protein
MVSKDAPVKEVEVSQEEEEEEEVTEVESIDEQIAAKEKKTTEK